jgi:hypothetical protein
MKWRDVIIGAVSTLLVTILGGVAVFYATKEPDEKKQELLSYTVNETAVFQSAAQNLVFSSVSVSNSGGVAAKNVSIRITLKNAEFKDVAFVSSVGLREKKRVRTAKDIEVVFEALLPKEKMSINFLLSKSEKPVIDIRSDSARAEEHKPLSENNTSTKSKILSVLEKLIPLLGVVGLSFLLIWFKFRGLFEKIFVSDTDKNTAGFLLLHSGLVKEAERIFLNAIRQGRCDSYIYSNYATCKALSGDFESAELYIRAANYRGNSEHAAAVVSFNEGIIEFLKGQSDLAFSFFQKAIDTSPKEIRDYFQKTRILDEAKTVGRFVTLFKN